MIGQSDLDGFGLRTINGKPLYRIFRADSCLCSLNHKHFLYTFAHSLSSLRSICGLTGSLVF